MSYALFFFSKNDKSDCEEIRWYSIIYLLTVEFIKYNVIIILKNEYVETQPISNILRSHDTTDSKTHVK